MFAMLSTGSPVKLLAQRKRLLKCFWLKQHQFTLFLIIFGSGLKNYQVMKVFDQNRQKK